MASVGPQLPRSSHDKRKREDDDHDENESESDSSIGPTPPAPHEAVTKKARVIGPVLPSGTTPVPSTTPANRPRASSSEGSDSDSDSESDDDGFGPSLPPAHPSTPAHAAQLPTALSETAGPPSSAPSKRDDWMTVAPTNGDWSSRIDPTKLKNRKFNTGKGSQGPSLPGNASNIWHETPAEKQARLQREMMGMKNDSSVSTTSGPGSTERMDPETVKRMADFNKSRGPTLYQSHQGKQTEKEDDPSARAFDREKDIGGGLQINSTQRRDMLKKASDFSTRFSSAKYL